MKMDNTKVILGSQKEIYSYKNLKYIHIWKGERKLDKNLHIRGIMHQLYFLFHQLKPSAVYILLSHWPKESYRVNITYRLLCILHNLMVRPYSWKQNLLSYWTWRNQDSFHSEGRYSAYFQIRKVNINITQL